MRRAIDTALFGITALLVCAVLTLMPAGCSTTQVASIDQQLVNGKNGEDVVIVSTDAALKAHLIKPAQALAVATIAHQVDPLMASVKAAVDAGDTANATKTMALVNALLAGLNAYVPPTGSSP